MNKHVHQEKQIIQAVDFIPRSTVPQGIQGKHMTFPTWRKGRDKKAQIIMML